MSTNGEEPSKPTAASLISGILCDLQRLVEQQFQLTRCEIEDEVRRRAAAALLLALGMSVFLVDTIILCLTCVHLLHWLGSPNGTDPAWLPLWLCHGVIVVILTVIGAILTQLGRVRFQSIERCPNPVIEISQEHASWTTPPK